MTCLKKFNRFTVVYYYYIIEVHCILCHFNPQSCVNVNTKYNMKK